jgi:hypothetical protein
VRIDEVQFLDSLFVNILASWVLKHYPGPVAGPPPLAEQFSTKLADSCTICSLPILKNKDSISVELMPISTVFVVQLIRSIETCSKALPQTNQAANCLIKISVKQRARGFIAGFDPPDVLLPCCSALSNGCQKFDIILQDWISVLIRRPS